MIKIINVENFIRERGINGPVTSPQIFLGKSSSFHPQGLLSEEIFGIDGSVERRNSVSWVELNCQVIHPTLYDLISKKIERRFEKILSGEKQYRISEKGNLEEDPMGELNGFSSLIKNINRIAFRSEETSEESLDERNRLIKMLYSNINNNNFFISKLLVISPEFRPVTFFDETRSGMPRIDPLNDIYRKIIILSNQIRGISGSLYDILSYRMQLMLKELQEWVRIKVSKKSGMIRDLMLGKRVDFSARSVIVPQPNLRLGEVGVPFRIICSIFEPLMIYGLINSPNAEKIPEEFHIEVKSILGKELDPELLV